MASNPNLYRFKEIQVVPGTKELIDIVLSRTQRKTPTEVHKQFNITRIRSFYMRKIKFCQQCYHEKLDIILTQFPRLDEIHPFYADLCNVLYDRDHYKLALGQCNTVKGIIDNIAKDYVRLIKYADSLYKCKMLKRAGLGRMSTAISKLKAALSYLEEVRQHLGRLPSINPNTRTLILTGYPNVGKSSFMNLVSNANVDVQPYAFTTKSLFVGHFDYAYTRWQIIDTPGVLDHPLEERNTIEMTAITALAHIQAAILYVLDLTEHCGYTLKAQVQLFHSIKPLFRNKPLIVLMNKVDERTFEDLEIEEKQLIESMQSGNDDVTYYSTSTLTGVGVDDAKNHACDVLLEQRINKKSEGKQMDALLKRIHVTQVAPSDERPPCIPSSVLQCRNTSEQDEEMKNINKTERDIEEEMGGAGVYSVDLRKHHMLSSDNWKYDVIPEMFNGKNIADFIDPDIERKLQELEKEEELLMMMTHEDENLDDKAWLMAQQTLRKIHLKANQIKFDNKIRRTRSGPILPHKGIKKAQKFHRLVSKISQSVTANETSSMFSEGIIKTKTDAATNAQSSTKSFAASNTEIDVSTASQLKKKLRQKKIIRQLPSRGTNRSLGLSKPADQLRMERVRRQGQKQRNRKGFAGDGDHFVGNKMPKHLFSGKMGRGKSNQR
ncbi:putative nucleolar GTP-binding protein 1 [Cardiosporidium cionae]|uniref:Nucleolar GTP-binding protein 1 n=1 Tax=Cardiosporidium cionae TaxID=476202 RepID=A0ABQ7JE48_9APIC|nr:putative nucleolar GTP-binding protein 1 [Cardiosporidium cionae]|eukprot:KAF8822149.1 putative nucleolar GTP-binding protein 1 [Cardiosporidium cionae]